MNMRSFSANSHLVLISASEFENIISGKDKFLVRFFKKRPEMLGKLAVGDLVYFKKNKGEIFGQFEVGSLIITENLEFGIWNLVREIAGMEKEVIEAMARENSILVAVRIDKLEQLITSPIEMPKSRKDWIVLGD